MNLNDGVFEDETEESVFLADYNDFSAYLKSDTPASALFRYQKQQNPNQLWFGYEKTSEELINESFADGVRAALNADGPVAGKTFFLREDESDYKLPAVARMSFKPEAENPADIDEYETGANTSDIMTPEEDTSYFGAAWRGFKKEAVTKILDAERLTAKGFTDLTRKTHRAFNKIKIDTLSSQLDAYARRSGVDEMTLEEKKAFYKNDKRYNELWNQLTAAYDEGVMIDDEKFTQEIDRIYDNIKRESHAFVADQHWEQRPNDSAFAYGLGKAGGSLLASVAVTSVAGGGLAGRTAMAGVFGAIQQESLYDELITKGVEPDIALSLSRTGGIFEAGIEMVGFGILVRNIAQKTLRLAAVKTFITQMGEGIAQKSSEEIVMNPYRKEVPLQDKILGILMAGLQGGLMGSLAAVASRPFINAHAAQMKKNLVQKYDVEPETANKLVDDAVYGKDAAKEAALKDIQQTIVAASAKQIGISDIRAKQLSEAAYMTQLRLRSEMVLALNESFDPETKTTRGQNPSKPLTEFDILNQEFDIKAKVYDFAVKGGASHETAETAAVLSEEFARVMYNKTGKTPREQWESGSALFIEDVRSINYEDGTFVSPADLTPEQKQALDVLNNTRPRADLSLDIVHEMNGQSPDQFKMDRLQKLATLKGTKIYNESIQAEIEIRPSTIRKYKSFYADKNKHLIVPYLPELLQKAHFTAEKTYTPKTERNVILYYKSSYPLEINGKMHEARLTAKFDNNGVSLWDVQVKEVAPQTGPATNPGVEGPVTELSGYKENLAQNDINVKNKSRTFDENEGLENPVQRPLDEHGNPLENIISKSEIQNSSDGEGNKNVRQITNALNEGDLEYNPVNGHETKSELAINSQQEMEGYDKSGFRSERIGTLKSLLKIKVFNKSLNSDIEIRKSSIKKYIRFFEDTKKRLVVPYLPQLLEVAKFKAERSYQPNLEKNINYYQKADVSIKVDEDVFLAHLTVKEDNRGSYLWDVQIKRKAPFAESVTSTGAIGLYNNNVVQNDINVKNKSRTFDENKVDFNQDQVQNPDTFKGEILQQSFNEKDVLDLTNRFDGIPTRADMKAYIDEVVNNAQKFATVSPDWVVDVQGGNRVRKKIINVGGHKGLNKKNLNRYHRYVMALEELLSRARYVGEQINTKKDEKPSVEKYHYFKTPVKVGEHVYEVVFDTEQRVGESEAKPQTVHLYNINEKSPGEAQKGRNLLQTALPDDTRNITQLNKNVNTSEETARSNSSDLNQAPGHISEDFNGDVLYQGGTDPKVVDLTSMFTKNPKIREVKEYINTIIAQGQKFATLSPDWLVDIPHGKRNKRKILNAENFKGLNYKEINRFNRYLSALEKLLENAQYLGAKPNKKEDKKRFVEKYHYFKSHVKIGNQLYEVLFDTEQFKGESEAKPQTVHLYNVSEISPDKATEGRYLTQTALSDDNNNIVDFNENVKEIEGGMNSTKSPRGYIMMNDMHNVIRLLKTADPSTLIHEMGHYFTIRYIDTLENMGQQNELTAVLKWLDVSNTRQLTRAHKERLARAFETYVMEGIAPNAHLKPLFKRFKNFISNVYKNLVGKVIAPEEINADMRAFFDKMLAVDGPVNVNVDALAAKPNAVKGVVDAALKGQDATIDGVSLSDVHELMTLVHQRLPRSLLDVIRNSKLADPDTLKDISALTDAFGALIKDGGATLRGGAETTQKRQQILKAAKLVQKISAKIPYDDIIKAIAAVRADQRRQGPLKTIH